MRIGLFTDSYLPRIDGVATSVASCALELEKMGHEVYVIAPHYPGHKDRKNVIRLFSVRVNETPETRLGMQVPQRSLLRLLRLNFDIIHGHSGGTITFLGWQIAQLRNIPYIATYHTLWNRYTHYFLRGVIRPRMVELSSALFGNICDGLIAPSDKVRDELKSYGIRKPIYTIPSGIVLEKFDNIKKGYLRKKYGLQPKSKILLTVSRLGKEKSIEFLLNVFADLYKKDSSTYFFIVGDGPYRKKLEERALQLGVIDRVCFTGPVRHKDIAKVYADADLFIFASRSETQGLVIVEAMASGLPVVAVNDSAYKHIIQNGINGFMVKKNVLLYAKQVGLILADSELRKILSRNAKKTASKFSVTLTAKLLLSVYTEMIEKQRHGRRSWKDVMKNLNNDISRLTRPDSRFTGVRVNMHQITNLKNFFGRYIKMR